jgi:hypothetical protein
VGISSNLRSFGDPSFGDFTQFPKSPKQAISLWASAIGPEISEFLLPSVPAGLISFPGGPQAFISTLTGNPLWSTPSPITSNLALGLDAAMVAAATAIAASSSTFIAVAPTSPFDSENKIFGKNKTAKEICDDCESRVREWLGTGTYSAWLIPGVHPGIPLTPWGFSPPKPPDSDDDGYPDDVDDKPNDPDKH